MCFLHFCYLEALYERTLSSGEQGAGRKIDFVEDFNILKCGFVPIRNNCQKTNQQGDSLQGNSYPKAVLLEVSQTAWTGKLWGPWSNLLEELPCITDSEQPTSPITWLPRSWADDLGDEREDSKGPLELFQSPPVAGFHWLKCNSKYTLPRLAEKTLQLASWQAQFTTTYEVRLQIYLYGESMPRCL